VANILASVLVVRNYLMELLGGLQLVNLDRSIPCRQYLVATLVIEACTFEDLDYTSVVTWEAALASTMDCCRLN
jgi:hypothetical protein